jgi:hypothetical protein
MLGVCVREMKALTVKVETVTLIGEYRYLTCFVHSVYGIDSDIFCLVDILFLRDHFRFG